MSSNSPGLDSNHQEDEQQIVVRSCMLIIHIYIYRGLWNIKRWYSEREREGEGGRERERERERERGGGGEGELCRGIGE